MARQKKLGIRTIHLEGPLAHHEARAPKIGRIKIRKPKRVHGVRKVKRVSGRR